MYLSTALYLLSVASIGAAAPTLSTRNDPTVCAPGTGFFQSCSNGFRGCCKADACSLGYCPPTSSEPQKPKNDWEHKEPATLPEGQCAPGTGFFQVCGNGFKGCCKADACSLGYCPPTPAPYKRDDTVCAPGTGFFQSCSNGFRGCCKADACSLGYCPTTPSQPEQPKNDWEHKEPEKPTTLPEGQCAPGTGFFQVCGNGFKGCCTADACSLGYCPPTPAPYKRDDTVCAPGTGFFQSCSNGFRGCCKADACSLGYCPPSTASEPEKPKTNEWEHKEPATLPEGQCAPGTGFFQVCGNGFKGCCKADACSLGYCPL